MANTLTLKHSFNLVLISIVFLLNPRLVLSIMVDRFVTPSCGFSSTGMLYGGSVVQTITDVSYIKCVSLCARDINCEAVNYHITDTGNNECVFKTYGMKFNLVIFFFGN